MSFRTPGVISSLPQSFATSRIDTSSYARDLRLDFFRGVALICIFIDHIPGNLLASYTVRNLGFSDASELLVFISAYTAGLVYMRTAGQKGLAMSSLYIWQRTWQIYVVHVFVLVSFSAMVAWSSMTFDNPSYIQGMNVQSFLKEPHVAILEALRLRFQPIYMDILPLYIVLLGVFPLTLALIRRSSWLAFAVSLALYGMTRIFDLHLLDYPGGAPWKFNPFAWQLLFVTGAILGVSSLSQTFLVPRHRSLLVLSATYVVFSYVFTPSIWAYEGTVSWLPREVAALFLPIMDRADLSLWRLTHVLALAYVATYFLRRDNPLLRGRVLRPVIVCGQHSLPIFCLGVLLSIAGWIVMVEVSSSPTMQFSITACGVLIMVGVASVLSLVGRAGADKGRGPRDVLHNPETVIAS